MTQTSWYQLLAGLIIVSGIVWYGLQPADSVPYDRPAEVLPPAKSIQVLLGGDVNMGRQVGQKILAGDVDYPFAKISQTLQDADITFVNLESQLADLNGETQSPTNEFRFAGPPQGAQSLANAGIDIVSLANNHMWDYGEDRLYETYVYLDEANVSYVGSTPDPAERCNGTSFEIKGQSIYFFAITTLLNGYETTAAPNHVCYIRDIDRLIEEIASTREFVPVDWIFVSIHTGTEYKTTPNPDMVALSHQLIDAGADVIIGHHPHVPQPIEIYNDKPIFYSLGNFAFWQPFSFWTQHSYLAKLTLTKTDLDYEIIPVRAGWQPEILTNEESIASLMDLLFKTQ